MVSDAIRRYRPKFFALLMRRIKQELDCQSSLYKIDNEPPGQFVVGLYPIFKLVHLNIVAQIIRFPPLLSQEKTRHLKEIISTCFSYVPFVGDIFDRKFTTKSDVS